MSDQGMKGPTSSLKCKQLYLQFIARLRGIWSRNGNFWRAGLL